MPAVNSLSQQLRSAVLAGDHAHAERLAVQYVEALRKTWETLSESQRVVSPMPEQARELMTWVRDVTLMQRALTHEQLSALEKAWHYQPEGWLEARSRAIEVKM